MPPSASKRIAIIFIRNADGAYFVHRRLASKRTYPNLYGLGAGGSIEASETAKHGAERELREETGLISPLLFVTRFTFAQDSDAYEIHLFSTESDGSPAHCSSEWEWSGWMNPSEVQQLFENDLLCPDTADAYERYRAWEQTPRD